MPLSERAAIRLKIAVADIGAGNEIVAAINAAESEDSEIGSPSSPVVPVAVTFTANAPSSYATPTGAVTVADGTALVAAEVFGYLDNLRANVAALQAILHSHGLTS